MKSLTVILLKIYLNLKYQKIVIKNFTLKIKKLNNKISKSFVSDVPITIASSGGLDHQSLITQPIKKENQLIAYHFLFDDENFFRENMQI